MVKKLVLTYFNIGARAEPIRLACAIGKVPFTNKVVAFKDWSTVRSKYPLGQLPLLEVQEDGKEVVSVGQSNAILRYVGKLGNLYPTADPVKAMKIDAFIDAVVDSGKGIDLSLQGPRGSLMLTKDWTGEEKLAMRNRLSTDENKGLPFYLNYFENALKENGSGWLVGSSITIADLAMHRVVAWIISGILDGISKDLVDGYPQVKKHYEAIEALPEVVAFRKNHPLPFKEEEFDYVP